MSGTFLLLLQAIISLKSLLDDCPSFLIETLFPRHIFPDSNYPALIPNFVATRSDVSCVITLNVAIERDSEILSGDTVAKSNSRFFFLATIYLLICADQFASTTKLDCPLAMARAPQISETIAAAYKQLSDNRVQRRMRIFRLRNIMSGNSKAGPLFCCCSGGAHALDWTRRANGKETLEE